jgi:hypothetical protein
MRSIFRHNTLRETSIGSKQVCTSKGNHKSRIEREKVRRSGMRIILWLQDNKKHITSRNVKDMIEKDTLRRTVGNCILRSAPNISRKRKKKALISVDVEDWVENTLDPRGKINFNNINK